MRRAIAECFERNVTKMTTIADAVKNLEARGWVFTINNYSEDEWQLMDFIQCRYIICGKEVGEKNGTPHIQGYVYFDNAKTMRAVSKQPGMKRAHLEMARAGADKNQKYCSKEGEWKERGEKPSQGERNDLNAMKKYIDAGPRDLYDCFNEDFPLTCKFHRAFERYILEKDMRNPRTERPTVYWIWGESGIGKTEWVLRKYGEDNVFWKGAEKWCPTYRRQTCFLIDDFDGRWEYRDFLRLLDRGTYVLEAKGSHKMMTSSAVCITCEFPPEHFWKDGNTLEQVTRRIDSILGPKEIRHWRNMSFDWQWPETVDFLRVDTRQMFAGNSSPLTSEEDIEE